MPNRKHGNDFVGRVTPRPGTAAYPADAPLLHADARIRIYTVQAHDGSKHECIQCRKRFLPAKSVKVCTVTAVYSCRNGVTFDFGGYLCLDCLTLQKGGNLTTASLFTPDEIGAATRRGRTTLEREKYVK